MARSEIEMKIGLDSTGVKNGLNQTGKNIESFSSSAGAKISAWAVAAKAAIVGAFIAGGKSALELGKEITNLANISNAGTTEFQKLAFGAKSVGIEQQKLADIFKDVNDKVGDFLQAGSGPMVDFFENIAPAIGVTADEFKNLSGPQALQLYYDSLEKANLSQQDMTFYMEAIASDATALIPLLKNGGELWNKYGEEAAKAGLILSQDTISVLKDADDVITRFNTKIKVMAAEFIGRMVEMGNNVKDLYNKLRGDDEGGGAGGISGKFGFVSEAEINSLKKLAKAAGDVTKEAGEFKGSIQGLADDVIKNLTGVEGSWSKIATETEHSRKLTEKYNKEIEKTKGILEKAAKEAEDRAFNELTSREQLAVVQEKIKAVQKEISDLTPGPLDPDFMEKTRAVADKILELQQLITKEKKTQGDVNEDQKEQEENILDAVKASAQQAVDTAEKIKAAQEEQIRLRDEQMEQQMKGLELERAIAEAMGDTQRVNSLDRQIERQSMINELIQQYGVDSERAADLVDNIIAKKDAQKQKELDVLKAQADGNDMLATQLQGRIDKEQEAIDLMNEFNLSLEEATKLAEKLAAMRAGPDLNQSGFVTPREQEEWDRRQAVIGREQDKMREQELADERQVGGRWLGKRIPEDISRAQRARERQEDRTRREENRQLQRIQRGGTTGDLGGNIEEARQAVAERRAQRQQIEQGWKEAEKRANEMADPWDRAAELRRINRQEKEVQDRLKKGEDLGDIMEDINKKRAEKGLEPVDVQPGDGQEPQQPPQNPVVAGLSPLLDKINASINAMSKKLDC